MFSVIDLSLKYVTIEGNMDLLNWTNEFMKIVFDRQGDSSRCACREDPGAYVLQADKPP